MAKINEFEGMNPESRMLLEKWGKELKGVEKGFDNNLDYLKKVNVAIMLESMARHMQNPQVSMIMNEASGTQLADVGFFKKQITNLISGVVPNLIAHDIVSVQPLLSRIGEARYLQILYGSDKGRVKNGDIMFSSFKGGNGETKYSSDEIEDELIELMLDVPKTKGSGNLSWLPIIPGKVNMLLNGSDEIKDNGKGDLIGTGITGSINYNTGAFEIDSSTPLVDPSDVVVNYIYDNINTPVSAPEVRMKIVSSPIVARSRKLKATYSTDASYDFTRDYGLDLDAEMTKYVAAQIKHEIDGEIMNEILQSASAADTSWSETVPTGVSLRDHNESFANKITEASNNIFSATNLASASFIIVGIKASNVIETLTRFKPAGAINPIGPHLVGYLGSTPIYKTPYYPEDQYLVGWKGTGLFDAGYVYCPYMPIISRALVIDTTFEEKRGFATSYGKKVVNGNMYSKGKIIN